MLTLSQCNVIELSDLTVFEGDVYFAYICFPTKSWPHYSAEIALDGNGEGYPTQLITQDFRNVRDAVEWLEHKVELIERY